MDPNLVKEKMLKYKESPGKDTLETLWEVSKDHLKTCTEALMGKYVFLRCEDANEIYQCCVMGLIKSCKAMTPEHKELYIATRIYFYSKQECFSQFRKFFAEKCGCGCEFLETADFNQTKDHVDLDLSFEELTNKIERMISSGELLDEDYSILLHVGMFGRTYKLTGEILNIGVDQVSARYKSTVKMLREKLDANDYIF